MKIDSDALSVLALFMGIAVVFLVLFGGFSFISHHWPMENGRPVVQECAHDQG